MPCYIKKKKRNLFLMAQLKAYNVIPLHLECAKTKQNKTKQKKNKQQQQQQNYNQKKKWNAKILITRRTILHYSYRNYNMFHSVAHA